MRLKISHRLLFLCILIYSLSTALFASDATGSFTNNLKVSGSVDLDVQTGSGNITIHTGGSDTITIYAKIRANDSWMGGGMPASEKVKRIEQDPPVKQNGNMISIGHIEDRELRHNVSISYEITVPTDAKVHSDTGSGDQDIEGIHGTLRANTGSGNVKARDIGNEVRANTGSGDVRLTQIKGHVYANTGSGNIEAKGVAGGMVAETGSGEIDYDQDSPGSVSAKTGSGSIHLHHVKGGVEAHTGSGDIKVDGEATANWTLRSGSGTIELRLPSQAAFDVDARSSSGSVSVNHPVTVQGTLKRNHIQGKVGNGGVLISMETGSGDIRID